MLRGRGRRWRFRPRIRRDLASRDSMLPRYLDLRDRLRTGGGLYKKDRPPLLLPCGGRRSPFSITKSNLAFQVTSPGLPIRFRQRLQDFYAARYATSNLSAISLSPCASILATALRHRLLPQRVPVIALEGSARPESGNSRRPIRDHCRRPAASAPVGIVRIFSRSGRRTCSRVDEGPCYRTSGM